MAVDKKSIDRILTEPDRQTDGRTDERTNEKHIPSLRQLYRELASGLDKIEEAFITQPFK